METVTIKNPKAKSGITIINAEDFDEKTMKKATAADLKKAEAGTDDTGDED